MNIDIRITEALSEPDHERLFGWSDNIFGTVGTAFGALSIKPYELHFVLYQDGQAVSHAAVLKHTVDVGGKDVIIGGVASVLTRPEAQGKGFSQQLLREATTFFKTEWHVNFGMLFCFERLIPFYQSMGWQQVSDTVYLDTSKGRVLSPVPVMILPVSEKTWPSGIVNINDYAW